MRTRSVYLPNCSPSSLCTCTPKAELPALVAVPSMVAVARSCWRRSRGRAATSRRSRPRDIAGCAGDAELCRVRFAVRRAHRAAWPAQSSARSQPRCYLPRRPYPRPALLLTSGAPPPPVVVSAPPLLGELPATATSPPSPASAPLLLLVGCLVSLPQAAATHAPTRHHCEHTTPSNAAQLSHHRPAISRISRASSAPRGIVEHSVRLLVLASWFRRPCWAAPQEQRPAKPAGRVRILPV